MNRNNIFFAKAMIYILISILTVSSTAQIFPTDGIIFIMPTNGTIFIMPDGSINGTTNIQTADNSTYVFTSNIYNDSIIVERDNIIIDGNGYALQGTNAYDSGGISLSGRTNVTVEHVSIQNFILGIFLNSSSKCRIFGNNVTNAEISLESSSNNTVSGNIAAANAYGIVLDSSSNNAVFGNIATDNELIGIDVESSFNDTIFENDVCFNGQFGLYIGYSSNNTIYGNNVTSNYLGIAFDISSNHNSIFGNYVANNHRYGIRVGWALHPSMGTAPSNNTFFHNNFLNNSQQVYSAGSPNSWDDGYPSGGNYWGDYKGTDLYSRPYQNETGYDWIGDSPYVIDSNNIDRYPLIYPFESSTQGIEVAYRNLLENFNALNASYQQQLQDYSNLYSNLQGNLSTLSSLRSNLNTLNSTFLSYRSSTQNEISYTRDLVYAFATTTVILIVVTVYLAIRKPKNRITS